MNILSIVIAHIILFVIIFVLLSCGYFILVLLGLNAYGQHDALMVWIKKIFKKLKKHEK